MILSTRKLTLGLVALMGVSLCFAQEKPAAKPEKHAKDEQEVALIKAVADAKDPKTKLAALEKWAKEYPQTEYGDERQVEFLGTYQTAGEWQKAFDLATQIIKTKPKDTASYAAILQAIYNVKQPSPAMLQTGEQVVRHILDHLEEIYGPGNKPEGSTDAQWAAAMPQMKSYAQRTLGYIAMTAKDNPKAETELIKTLQLDPAQVAASVWLAQVAFDQRQEHPEKQVLAIFENARAASYDGPGALDAANRDACRKRFANFYKQYHGSEEGAADVLSLAKTNAVPPPNFTIKDIGTIKQEAAIKEQEERAKDPMMTLWRDVKKNLTDSGDTYFESDVKEHALPPFKGKLVSHKPALRPKELLLAVENPAGDLIVKLDEGQTLAGKMEPGEVLTVEGVGAAYTKEPYLLTVTADKAKITGWTGKNTTTPAKPTGKGPAKSVTKKGL